jgi:hypothetical protein
MIYPFINKSINVVTAAASAQVTGIKKGVGYRVISTVAAWLYVGGTAAANTGMYIPPNVECFMQFAVDDSQGTDPDVRVYAAAGTICFTPVFRTSA